MLTRLIVAAASAAVLVISATSTANADPDDGPSGDVTCPPNSPVCVITVKKPGTKRHYESASSRRVCRIPDNLLGAATIVPCSDKDFGQWSNADGCYYKLANPQPPKSNPLWEGHTDGAIYEGTCFGFRGTSGLLVWRAAPPLGPALTPEQLAQQAIRELPISGPDIEMAPEPGKQGLVGLPVWMWTDVTPETWGPATATAVIPGLSITATAKATKVVWVMGDGTRVTCDGPGTPYSSATDRANSPDCGHVYRASSAGHPGAAYRVTATTTWHVTWVGGGEGGELNTTRTSATTTQIGELQVLTS